VLAIVKTLLTQEQLREGVLRLAREINKTYGDRPLTIVGVLTGSIVLLADLIRLLDMPLRVGVLQASSYRDGTRPGKLIVNSEMMLDIRDRDVLLIDDIFDTGHTLVKVIEALGAFHPRSVRSAVLLRKAARQEVEFTPDFIGFEIPDEFVVGYGLDYADLYRNLPYLAALEPADLAASNP
jgi:hypoxanthine phosphoribosyltransferase